MTSMLYCRQGQKPIFEETDRDKGLPGKLNCPDCITKKGFVMCNHSGQEDLCVTFYDIIMPENR